MSATHTSASGQPMLHRTSAQEAACRLPMGAANECNVMSVRFDPAIDAPLCLPMVAGHYVVMVTPTDGVAMNLWSCGGPEAVEATAGTMVHLFDLRHAWSIAFRHPVSALLIEVPCDAIAVAVPSRHGLHGDGRAPVHDVSDSIVRDLVLAAMSILTARDEAGRSALLHVIHALLNNVCAGHCSYRVHPRASCERLAPWQEQRIRTYVTENLAQKIRAVDVSKQCGISCSHFSRLFKNTLGLTLRQWVIEQRVEHAKQLLLGSNASIADVANDAGFADQAHFSRIFSKATHCSPLAWRRSRRAVAGTLHAQAAR